MNEVWSIFSDYLYLVHIMFEVEIRAFVLMNNHFHLLIRTPNANIGEVMNYFMREVSREIGRQTNRVNHVFGGQYRASLITKDIYLHHAYKYIYRNPVEARICQRVEQYPYSTLYGLMGSAPLYVPMNYDNILFPHVENTLDWLNKSYLNDQKEVIKNALTRAEYKLTSRQTSRRKHELEFDIS